MDVDDKTSDSTFTGEFPGTEDKRNLTHCHYQMVSLMHAMLPSSEVMLATTSLKGPGPAMV